MDNKENNTPLSGERVPQAKSVEKAVKDYCKIFGYKPNGFAAIAFKAGTRFNESRIAELERELQSCGEHIQSLEKINKQYFSIIDTHIISSASYTSAYVDKVIAENAKLREALEGIKTIHESKDNIEAKHVHWESVSFGMYLKAEQALKGKEVTNEQG